MSKKQAITHYSIIYGLMLILFCIVIYTIHNVEKEKQVEVAITNYDYKNRHFNLDNKPTNEIDKEYFLYENGNDKLLAKVIVIGYENEKVIIKVDKFIADMIKIDKLQVFITKDKIP